MKQETICNFLNKGTVRLLVDVGQPKPFHFIGVLVSADGDDVFFDDCKRGKMAFDCHSILAISFFGGAP